MKCGGHDSPASVLNPHYAPYASTLATSASASSSSVWSHASSLLSDDAPNSAPTPDSDSCDSCCHSRQAYPSETKSHALRPHTEAIPAELRKNPRRPSTGSASASGCPPTLVRQEDRK